jgi:hypothetical protein
MFNYLYMQHTDLYIKHNQSQRKVLMVSVTGLDKYDMDLIKLAWISFIDWII